MCHGFYPSVWKSGELYSWQSRNNHGTDPDYLWSEYKEGGNGTCKYFAVSKIREI